MSGEASEHRQSENIPTTKLVTSDPVCLYVCIYIYTYMHVWVRIQREKHGPYWRPFLKVRGQQRDPCQKVKASTRFQSMPSGNIVIREALFITLIFTLIRYLGIALGLKLRKGVRIIMIGRGSCGGGPA